MSIQNLLILVVALFSLQITFSWDATYGRSLNENEVRELAVALAPKVNLFREVWTKDPEAAFFAGTSRDFIYWIIGQFRDLKTEDEYEKKKKKLRELELIDIREIIAEESDIDVIGSKESISHISAEKFSIRKIEAISNERLDPSTDEGKSEIDQGFIPAEKLLLTKNGIKELKQFGSPLSEIVDGRISLTFSDPERFWKTKYASDGLNHPVLLAVRYIRLRAQDYYNRHGSEKPDSKILLDWNPLLQDKIKKIFSDAIHDPKFREFLKNPRSIRFLNGSLMKAFRNYTNAEASFILFNKLGFQELQTHFSEQIEPLNQFMFKKYRNPKVVEQHLKEAGINPETDFLKTEELFPDQKYLHGTRSAAAFRSIISYGIRPSEGGSVGPGLYGVASKDEATATNHGGSKQYLISFEIAKSARIIEYPQPKNQASAYEGHPIYLKWKAWRESKSLPTENIEDLYEDFGIDLIRFDYGSHSAFCIKNSAVLTRPSGVYWKLKNASNLFKNIEEAKTTENAFDLMNDIIHNAANFNDVPILVKRLHDRRLFKSESLTNHLKDPQKLYYYLIYKFSLHEGNTEEIQELLLSNTAIVVAWIDEASRTLPLDTEGLINGVLSNEYLLEIDKIRQAIDHISLLFHLMNSDIGYKILKAIIKDSIPKHRNLIVGQILTDSKWAPHSDLLMDLIKSARSPSELATIASHFLTLHGWHTTTELTDLFLDMTQLMADGTIKFSRSKYLPSDIFDIKLIFGHGAARIFSQKQRERLDDILAGKLTRDLYQLRKELGFSRTRVIGTKVIKASLRSCVAGMKKIAHAIKAKLLPGGHDDDN